MATRANLVIDRGTDYSVAINVTQSNGAIFNLTGYNAECQLRKHWSSNNVYTMTATVSDAINGVITLGANNAYTSTIPPGRYQYDIEVHIGGASKSRVLQGQATVTPEVTR
jgi:hypothetical protein